MQALVIIVKSEFGLAGPENRVLKGPKATLEFSRFATSSSHGPEPESSRVGKICPYLRWLLAQLGNIPFAGCEGTVNAVQDLLGHEFARPATLVEALTHSSYSNEYAGRYPSRPVLPDNERLEYLGDAVLGIVVAELLMGYFPSAREGQLSRWRSSLVSRRVLSELASELGIGRYLLLGCGEKRSGGEFKASILASSMEALIGALYLDGGIDKSRAFLLRLYGRRFQALLESDGYLEKMIDKKTYLQERTQGRFGSVPSYRVVDTWGLEHEKYFRVELSVNGEVVSSGDGSSKKEAEQVAAGRALEILGF